MECRRAPIASGNFITEQSRSHAGSRQRSGAGNRPTGRDQERIAAVGGEFPKCRDFLCFCNLQTLGTLASLSGFRDFFPNFFLKREEI